VFGEFYRDPKIFDVSQKLGIELVDFSKVVSSVPKEPVA